MKWPQRSTTEIMVVDQIEQGEIEPAEQIVRTRPVQRVEVFQPRIARVTKEPGDTLAVAGEDRLDFSFVGQLFLLERK